jgi:hypothetical protein
MENNQNNFSFDTRDFVKIYDVFDTKFCKKVIKEIEQDKNWGLHAYYDYSSDSSHSNDDDLDVLINDSKKTNKIMEKLYKVIENYIFVDLKSHGVDFIFNWHGYTKIRYNRYKVGTRMKLHCDHIHSIFDGNLKGVPWLTLLGSLNDKFEGGELILFKNIDYKLKPGQVMVFPSTLMYPHEVLPVKKGTRYSFVSWVW